MLFVMKLNRQFTAFDKNVSSPKCDFASWTQPGFRSTMP
ncbi:hypothetical protein BACIT_3455 [Bacillus amyloliquefaciens]|nr:hypothetical protein BACIT_3455 [Bacillus amyloliquefaciens]